MKPTKLARLITDNFEEDDWELINEILKEQAKNIFEDIDRTEIIKTSCINIVYPRIKKKFIK